MPRALLLFQTNVTLIILDAKNDLLKHYRSVQKSKT